jgi:hypothetical protein
MSSTLLTACLAVSVVLAGCSFGLRAPGPVVYDHTGIPMPPDCTTSDEAPIIDLVAGGALVVLGASMVASESSSDDPADAAIEDTFSTLIGVPLLVAGAVQALVGVRGFGTTNACRERRAQHQQAMAAQAQQRPLYLPVMVPPR